MKILPLLPLIPMLAVGCSYHTKMGENDRYHVDSTANMFAPSVTTVTDTKADMSSTYAGPSIAGQLVNAAGTVAGGYLLGAGIAKSGTNNSVSNQNTPIASGGAGGNAAGGAGGDSNAAVSTSQSQGQLQFQGQAIQ